MTTTLLTAAIAVLLTLPGAPSVSDAVSGKAAAPTREDRCPICGMFVAKYPDWTAQASCRSGQVFFFDGVKDCFKWLLSRRIAEKTGGCGEVVSVYVTDYYSLKAIDGRTAWFVLGSDIVGPMGHELIPFDSLEAASEFLADHHGEEIVEFKQISPDLIQRLH